VNVEERALSFRCADSWLYGIASVPEQLSSRGVLIVVGGPQYRAGSHRQFTLLARELAARGVPAMRFDYRGMGDSDGDIRTFEDIGDDIRRAVDRFQTEVPAISEVVIWGLCDAASAALFYAHRDPRVCGLVLLNPWVRTVEGEAKAYLKHYYASRLFDRKLWSKVVRGRFDYSAAARSLVTLCTAAIPGTAKQRSMNETPEGGSTGNVAPLPERMLEGFERFKGKVLLIMSGNDLTAREFQDVADGSGKWKKLLQSPRVQRRDLPQANHTFSRRAWRDQVALWTGEWVRSW
jgi:exosortase A-associated hydrolase 1